MLQIYFLVLKLAVNALKFSYGKTFSKPFSKGAMQRELLSRSMGQGEKKTLLVTFSRCNLSLKYQQLSFHRENNKY